MRASVVGDAMDAATIARETASRLRVQHPQGRYELDWKTPEQLLVAAVRAGGSRDAAVNDVSILGHVAPS